jgi:thioesterase domain-containing protein
MDAKTLENAIRQGIPLSQHMDFRILELDKYNIRVQGDGEKNINVHGTAFAGSLYVLCTLASWGLVHTHLPKNSALVIADAQIHYLLPVKGDIIAEAHIQPAELETFHERLNTRGRARIPVSATVDYLSKRGVEYSASLHASLT